MIYSAVVRERAEAALVSFVLGGGALVLAVALGWALRGAVGK